MIEPPNPPDPCDNAQRLEALRRYGILDTPPEEAFDGIARLAAHVCHAPIALISFIDEGRQWFKSEVGLGIRETPLDMSICAHAILQPGLFVVPDTSRDERFAGNPLVTSEPHLRFYAGVSLETSDGHVLGTLCVLDHVPRGLDEAQQDALLTLAGQVMAQLELRRELATQARIQGELRRGRNAAEQANRALTESEDRLREQTRIAEALNRIGGLLASEHDLERLVQVVTDEATRLTDARFGAFFYNMPAEGGGAYTLYTISGVPREAFSQFPLPRATLLFGPTFRGEGVVRLDDVTQDPRYGKNAPYYGMPEGHLPVRSYLAVPVTSRAGEVLGGLFFGHPEPGVFAEPDERLVAGIAAQAAVAIDNARLYRELRAAKEEAESANQAKTQFLAVLSHELRTPLNPILLAASSMLERPADPQELRPTLEMIRQNVLLQARLIDDLLDVMRIVRGKMPLHWEVADCHKLIAQAVQVCRSEVLGHELRLVVEAAARHRYVNADPARLQQVFWNLIKNAVKFTPEGGTVTVRTRNQADPGGTGGLIVVEVGDTGIGIEPEVLPVIFDPFQQGETTITRRFGGLGLGLAICKGIIDAHGGTIAAESRGRGHGTTFRVVLKALPDPVGEEDGGPGRGTPVLAEAPHASIRILAVEDEPATLRLMDRLLRGLGHEVSTAGSVAEAMRAYEGGSFDLIISDIGLPDATGLDLMRRAVALRGPVPAIALTGYGMEEDIRRSREAGFTAHLTKPIDFAKLEAMIRQVAGGFLSSRIVDG